ncbi:MAG: TonB-dependent receptor [Bacteroidetes bacterium]|nr:MAG: TonB-dependent receptor [Bacteroidota bacterium]
MRLFKRLCASVLVLICAIGYSASAQTLIKFSGKVSNQKNEPVPGATIKVQGVRELAADIEGRYVINLPTGKYTFVITATGYKEKIIEDIEVKVGGDNILDVVLEDGRKQLESVVVRVSRKFENTNALLSQQKNNPSLSSGIAADFIRRTPDKNTGDILKRVSGASVQGNGFVVVRGLSDRYNAATINGAQLPSTEPDRKSFSFDVIPALLVDQIVVNKTATPEISGEFAGGLIEVKTKDVPTQDLLSVGVSFGFNTNSVFKDFISNQRGNTDWLGYDDGRRNIPAGFPGDRQAYSELAERSGGVNNQIAASKLFRSDVYNQVQSQAAPIQTYNISYGIGRRFKNQSSFGLVFAANYRNAQMLYQVDRGLFLFDGDPLRRFNDDQNKYATSFGGLLNLTYQTKSTKISFKNLVNQNFEDNYYNRTGRNLQDNLDLRFNSSFANQRTLYSGQLEGEQRLGKKGVILKASGNLSYNFKTQPDLRTVSYFRRGGTPDPFQVILDESIRFFSNLSDYGFGGSTQLVVPFTLAKEKQTFKVGASTLLRLRDFEARNFRYIDAFTLAPGLNTQPFNTIFSNQNVSANGWKLDEITQREDKYFGVSGLTSGYFMFDNKFGKVRLVWGARAENFQQVLKSRRSDLASVKINTEKLDILPSVNFTYNINQNHLIRAAGSVTVARPEFREIAPFSFFDYVENYSVVGDTNLKRSRIINGDVRYEWYPKAGESVSFGVFVKQFDDPIELRANSAGALTRRQYQYQNADEALTYGFEVEARKGLDFFGRQFKDFNLFANFTYIRSNVKLATVTSGGAAVDFDRPLQGQSPYLINLGVQYNQAKGNWNGSLLYNRIGQRLYLVGGRDFGLFDIYERPRDVLDLQISRKVLNRRGEIKLTVSDILNNSFYFYENVDDKKAFKSTTDRLFYSFKPGTTFTFGFTYDFIK